MVLTGRNYRIMWVNRWPVTGKGGKGEEGRPLLFLPCPSRVLGKPEGRQVTGFLVTQLSQPQEASNTVLFPLQTACPKPPHLLPREQAGVWEKPDTL